MNTPHSAQPVLHSTALYAAAAEALAAVLPTAAPITVRLHAGARDSARLQDPRGRAAASFVGQLSADVAVQVDGTLLGEAGGLEASLVSVSDVLRPSLEAATAVLGIGVLSAAAPEAADALLADGETVLFELESVGGLVGWFAMRIRDHGGAVGAGAPAAVIAADDAAASRLGRINNVEMSLTVEIGRTRMSVRELLNLEPGAVVELDRSAGAPADVLLNGRVIAHGEVVVMDQDYGVRITKILDVSEGLG